MRVPLPPGNVLEMICKTLQICHYEFAQNQSHCFLYNVTIMEPSTAFVDAFVDMFITR